MQPKAGHIGTKGGSVHERAFTLAELLVTIAIIAILAAILLPVLSVAKKRGAQAVCINNQRQLAIGMQIYINDNNGAFPGIASRLYGFQPEDWIYWRTNTALYPSFEKSPILSAVSGMTPASLRCPLDPSDADRLAADYSDGYGPYLFSYSFTGYGLVDGKDVGMSSIIDTSGGSTNAILFRETAVRNPSQKIMLAEEPGASADSDSPDGTFISDGRWVPAVIPDMTIGHNDWLTLRHGGKADVAFADGHVEPETPDFGSDPANSQPDL